MKKRTVVITITTVTDVPLADLRRAKSIAMLDAKYELIAGLAPSEAPRVMVSQPPQQ